MATIPSCSTGLPAPFLRTLAERRLGVLYEVAKVLAEASTLEEASTKILQQVGVELGCQFGSLWKVDSRAGHLRCEELWTVDPIRYKTFSQQTRESTFTPGSGLPGRVWQSGQSAWIQDVSNDHNFPLASSARTVGLHGALAFPITFREGTFGVMEFFGDSIQEWDEPLLTMLNLLGSQFSLFAECRRLEVAQTERVAEFESQMTAINKVQAVIEFSLDGTILTANENFLRMMGYALEEIQGQHHRMFNEPRQVESPEYQAFWAKLNRGEYDAGVYERVGKGGREGMGSSFI